MTKEEKSKKTKNKVITLQDLAPQKNPSGGKRVFGVVIENSALEGEIKKEKQNDESSKFEK